MALKIDSQRKMLEFLKFPKEKIDEICGDGEHDADLPALQIFDDAGLTELKANVKKAHEKDYPEIWGRQMNDKYKLGLTAAQAKDNDKVLEALKAYYVKEAGIAPDAAKAEWEEKFKTLQATIDTKETEGKSWQQRYEDLQSNEKYRKLFWAEMNDALDDSEWLMRLRNNFEIVIDGDVEGLKDKATGKFITDEKLNVLPYKEAFAAKLKEEKYASWNKPKAAATPDPDPRKTHDPRSKGNPNPANKTKKYTSQEDIMKEVDRKYPKGGKGVTNKMRQQYYDQLASQLA